VLRAIVFDYHGVLYCDDDHRYRAYKKVLSSLKIDLGEDEYFEQFWGLDDRSFFSAYLTEKTGESPHWPHIKELVDQKNEHYLADIESNPPLGFSMLTIVRTFARKVPLALLADEPRENVQLFLETAGLGEFFSVVVCAEDVEAKKPDPEGHSLAITRIRERIRGYKNLKDEECLAIEHSPIGIWAAKSVGMRCMAVTTTRFNADLADADKVVDSLVGVDVASLRTLFV